MMNISFCSLFVIHYPFIYFLHQRCLIQADCLYISQDEIQDTNSGLQKSCAPLLSKGGELTKCRRIQRNIASSIESLTLCLPVLEMYGKLQEQMRSKRFVNTLHLK